MGGATPRHWSMDSGLVPSYNSTKMLHMSESTSLTFSFSTTQCQAFEATTPAPYWGCLALIHLKGSCAQQFKFSSLTQTSATPSFSPLLVILGLPPAVLVLGACVCWINVCVGSLCICVIYIWFHFPWIEVLERSVITVWGFQLTLTCLVVHCGL